MQQLRFYRRDEQLMSPFLAMLFVASVSFAVVGLLMGSTPMLALAVALLVAPIKMPEMLELPTIARMDRKAERWAPYVIETAARARRVSSFGFSTVRWATAACACALGLFLLIDLSNAADGVIRTVLTSSLAVGVLQTALWVVVIGALAIPAMWIIEWAERSTNDGELVSTPVLTAASVAAGLRTRNPAVLAWWILGVTGLVAVGPDLVTRLLG